MTYGSDIGRSISVAASLLALLPMPATTQAQTSTAALSSWSPDTPERLAIRAEIEALGTEYYYRIDHGDAPRAAELFTKDGILHIGADRIVGRDAVHAYYIARSKTRITRHVSTNLRLTYIDANHVEAVRDITYYHGDPAASPGPYPANPSVTEYRESLVRGDDHVWRYAARVASLIFPERK